MSITKVQPVNPVADKAVILGIIAISMIPVVIGWWQQRRAA